MTTTHDLGRQVLAAPMTDDDSGATTIREYLVALAARVWGEGEDFSGKRPFGNSGWHRHVFAALAGAGLIDGTRDEYDRLSDAAEDRGRDLIAAALKALAEPDAPREAPVTGTTVFALVRDVDVSGVSGTGVVADGVVWPDGTASVRWRGEHPSIVFWRTLDSVKHIHGHDGATRIVLPSSERERLGRIADAHAKDGGPHGTTSGLCVECGQPWECPTYVWATTARDADATWDPADDEPEETR